jgi:hypothetical protein
MKPAIRSIPVKVMLPARYEIPDPIKKIADSNSK